MPEKGSTKEAGGRNTLDRKATTRGRSSGPLGLPRNPKLIAAIRHHHLAHKDFRPSGQHLWMQPASGPPALAHQSTAPTVWR